MSMPARGHGLVYVMGASGSGKDTLLRHVAARLREDDPILIAHRYITRAGSAHEASLELSREEFARRVALGCFALHWQGHGLHYGIGIEIDAWLEQGRAVVVNGSRAHLAAAARRYPALCAVEVQVEPGVLARRLAERGRESPQEIAERLARAGRPYSVPAGLAMVKLDNSGPVEAAAQALLELARARADATAR